MGQNTVMHSAQELVHCMDRLASLPPVFHRIQIELDSPDASLARLAQLIASDPALTATILKVANSAFYGFPHRIDTISRAVQILGMQQVRDLSVAILVTRSFTDIASPHIDPELFWRHSVLRAVACRAALQACGTHHHERGFVIGLLADIGHMVMYLTIPELAVEAAERSGSDPVALATAERELIGCDSAEVGAGLVTSWGMPDAFGTTIGAQHRPQLAGSEVRDAWVLCLANQIVDAEARQTASAEAAAGIDPTLWDRTGLKPEQFAAIREEAELSLASALALFFPNKR